MASPCQNRSLLAKLEQRLDIELPECAAVSPTAAGGILIQQTDGNNTRRSVEITARGGVIRETQCGSAVKDKYEVAERPLIQNDRIVMQEVPQPLCTEEKTVRTGSVSETRLENAKRLIRQSGGKRNEPTGSRPCRTEMKGGMWDVYDARGEHMGQWLEPKDARNHLEILKKNGQCNTSPAAPAVGRCALLETSDGMWRVFLEGRTVGAWLEEEEARQHIQTLIEARRCRRNAGQ